MDATTWWRLGRLRPRLKLGVAAAQVVAALAAIYLANVVSGMLFSDAPSCAPSRGSRVTSRARRPLWLADALEAAGIAATTQPSWPWLKSNPTEVFKAARQVCEISSFAILASASTFGVFVMDHVSVCSLVALQTTVAAALLAIVSTWAVENSFSSLIGMLATIAVGMAIEGTLAAVPLFVACGRAGSWLLGHMGMRHTVHVPTESQCISNGSKVLTAVTHPNEYMTDTEDGDSSSSDDEDQRRSLAQ